MTTKVLKIESYEDAQGKHIVTKGVLKLIPAINTDDNIIFLGKRGLTLNMEYRESVTMNKLIIISDEPIEIGDKVFINNTIKTCIGFNESGDAECDNGLCYDIVSCTKIIVLPNQFSPKHLQAIVDGKLKDGDKVFVECDEYLTNHKLAKALTEKQFKESLFYSVKLNQSSYVKLFRVENKLTWEEIFGYSVLEIKEMLRDYQCDGEAVLMLNLIENYNPPTKK